jgi:uncharacterized protein
MEQEDAGMATDLKHDIVTQLQSYAPTFRALGVARLGIFGSIARGTAHADSDVDVLVEFVPGRKSFDSFMTLALMLEQVLARSIDLVTSESLSPHIGPAILREVEYVALNP